MNTWSIMEEELEKFRDSVLSVRRILQSYEQECKSLISDISKLSFNEAQSKFDALYAIQRKISTMKYKYDFPLESKWNDFSYNLDRDDEFSRKYWHVKFTGGSIWPSE